MLLVAIQPAVRRSVCGDLHMGKGKGPNIGQRGELKKRAEMERMREQMFGDDRDGFPVFTVYVRSKKGQVYMHTRTSLHTFTVLSLFYATTYVSGSPNAPAFT
jgi:hypothetical protein